MGLFELKNREFMSLTENLKKLNKSIKEIETKIEDEGMDAYYSINSDILEYAHNAFVSMRVLGYIKNFKGERLLNHYINHFEDYNLNMNEFNYDFSRTIHKKLFEGI